jgi:AraC-like DNA-binding protein
MGSFAQVTAGRECWSAHRSIPRHRHERGYVALVLAGGYEECGSRGRFCVGPGDVLLHDAFDAHLDRFKSQGAEILNLVMENPAMDLGLGRVADPDSIARAAERDLAEAAACLRERLSGTARDAGDWPDLLARDLAAGPDCCLGAWARAHGLAAETLSRGFGKVFGLTPAAFRAEVRAHRAFALVAGSDAPLASIAAAAGFADQAHMCRALRALTGAPPTVWRRSNPFKTAANQAV